MIGVKHLLRLFCHRGQLILISYRMCDLMRHQQLLCGIDCHLNMITDIDALTGFHGATIRIGQRELTFFPSLPCLKQLLVLSLARV
jgi:hypothetical protein